MPLVAALGLSVFSSCSPDEDMSPIIIEKSESAKFYAKSEFTTKEAVDGKPNNEWYEIAGSEYNNPKTIRNYEITYYRPETEEKDADYDPEKTFVTIKKYIRWEDNQGNSGYLEKNMWHNQSYYPGWVKEDKLTFRGTRLPDNAVEESGEGKYWVQYCFDYGYVDNLPNGDIDNAIDIDWVVDKDGKKVNLPGIDFVRVYCGMRQECGWLGETSTEIQGATDLHMRGVRLTTRP